MTWAALVTMAVVAVGACSGPRAHGRGGGPVDASVFRPGPYGLYEMVRPAGSDPVPEGYDEAERRFEAGRVHYDAGRWIEAARAFLHAADALPRNPLHHATTLAADRTACYRNATSAFLMAGARDEGRRALEPLVASDAECADALRAEIARLAQ